jgi:hypothetical protein
MPTSRPFALNTGSTISGTEQLGDLAIGVDNLDYTTNPGGVRWWGGPDEDSGYIICYPVYSQDRSSPDGPIGSVGFKRSKQKTEQSFIQIAENMSNFTVTFNDGNEARNWCLSNGYWPSYLGTISNTPTPTLNATLTPTQSVTPTPTPTPTSSVNNLLVYLDAGDTNSYPTSGSTWFDLTSNNNDATLVNSPTYSSANGGTFNFDETNDYVLVNNTAILPTAAYTKIAVFRPESSTSNIISGGSDGQHAFWMGGTSTTLQAGHNGNWGTVTYSPGDMLNQWWIGAVTFNTVTGWVLYLNGQQVNTNASTTTFVGGNVVRIAAYTNASNLFDGDIAIAMIYNRVLSAQEILQNYNATKSRFGL